ncbi:hypothetical protein GCM10009127_20640 [Alteraurantiacibacter aestuarii]|uniref:hypothetical protein n=1 Tax=Alteraurantiacibacter aestuarii TaxID=650004 RepID=UPI0031CF60BC
MIAHRAAILLAGAATLTVFAIPATAQVNETIVLNIMRECARIDDPTARLACYDNNIRSAGGNPRNTVPGEVVVQGGAGAPLTGGGVAGFGREDVRTPDRFQTPAGSVDAITATVTDVSQREPGIYLLTLEDGAQWIFSDSVDRSYGPPRRGSEITIQRAAMDSFLMRYNGQRSVRIRRLR